MFGWYRCKFFLPFLLCALIKELTWKHLPILCSQGQLYSDVLFAVYESVAKLVVNCVFHYDSVAVTNTLTNFLHRSRSLWSQSCKIIKWSEITNDEWGDFLIALSSHRKIFSAMIKSWWLKLCLFDNLCWFCAVLPIPH